MKENSVSKRTKKQNLVKNKTQAFKTNLNLSELRMKSQSTSHQLATKLYTDKKPKDNESKTNKNSSTSKLPNNSTLPINPQTTQLLTETMAVSGLVKKAHEVSNIAQHNTKLLSQKKSLQEHIKQLKQSIKSTTHNLDKTAYRVKKLKNDLEKTTNLYQQAHQKSNRLNVDIKATNHDIAMLTNKRDEANTSIQQRQNELKNTQEDCLELNDIVKKLKVNHLNTDKDRNVTKSHLIDAQKGMNKASITVKELEDERATLLIQINQSVSDNRLVKPKK